MRIHTGYGLATIILFSIECGIALFFEGGFIRGFVGDVLVVALLYSALLTVFQLRPLTGGMIVLAIAFTVEAAQWAGLIHYLGLRDNTLARTVLGAHFDVKDLLAYSIGFLNIIVIENAHHSSFRAH